MIVLFIFALTLGASQQSAPDDWEFVSPLPGSAHNSRESSIILRPGPAIDASSLKPGAVRITGSRSGLVHGRFFLSPDGRTMLFHPDSRFEPGEVVRVQVKDGIRSVSSAPVGALTFAFAVTEYEAGPNPYDLIPEIRPNRVTSADGVSKVATDSIPPRFPPMKVDIYDSTAIGDGYIFLAVASEVEDVGYYLMMLNNDGSPFFARELAHDYAYDFKPQPNGQLSYAHFFEHHSYTGGGNVVHKILDASFALVDSVQMGNGYVAEAHDFQILPNGHYLLFGYYLTPVDMSEIVDGGRPDALVSGGIVQELDVAKNVIFQWRSWDHHSFEDWEFSSRQATRAIVSEFHLNTVNLDDDGNIFLSTPRWTKKINRQTGAVIWTLGGHENEFSFANVDSTEGVDLASGHTFHRLGSGNILLYDNGNRQGTRSSRVNEFRMEEENRQMELVWTYEPDDLVAGWHRGSAQRLPNGNTVIGWGGSSGNPSPAVTEVDSSGRKLYELTFVPPAIESYRAFRFPFTGGLPVSEVTLTEVAPGSVYEFAEGDSIETGIAIEVHELDGTGYNELTVQRYDHAPIKPEFAGKAPRVKAARMVLQQFGLTGIEAEVIFDVDSWDLEGPANTIVYHREFEGKGLFLALPTSFNPAKRELSASADGFGEFILARPDFESVVFPPLLLHPADSGTVNQELPVMFEWTPVGYATGYDLQVALDAGFTDLLIDVGSVAEATYATTALARETGFFWRVRSINDAGVSGWTSPRSFRTLGPYIELDAPAGGEELVRGLDFYIRWRDNLEEDVVIELHLHDSVVDTIAVTPSDGAYMWEVDPTLDRGPGYWIKIFSSLDNSIVDSNSESFVVTTTRAEEEAGSALPTTYKLAAAYPNPFNPQTTLRFELPAAEHVSLTVFDVSGRLVRTLVDEVLNSGRYEVSFDASGLPSGLYFYRMNTPHFERTGTVVLLK